MIDIKLTTIQRDIVLALLKNEDKHTMNSLAHDVRVDKRAIRYNLQFIKMWLEGRGCEIQSRRGYGLELISPEIEKQTIIEYLENYENLEIRMTPEQRIDILLLCLLGTGINDSTCLYESLSISKRTLAEDFNRLKAMLQEFNLVIKDADNLIQVIGKESDRRKALQKLLRRNIPEEDLVLLSRKDVDLETIYAHICLDEFREYFRDIGFARVKQVLDEVRARLHRRLTASSYIELFIYLVVMVWEIKQNRAIEADMPDTHLKSDESRAMKSLVAKVEQEFGIDLSSLEVNYLSMLLHYSLRKFDILEYTFTSTMPSFVNPEYVDMAKMMIKAASERLHPWLLFDQDFSIQLAIYLDYVIPRLKNNIPVNSLDIDDIEDLFPEVVSVAEEMVERLEDKIDLIVPDTITAEVALHLAAALERLDFTRSVQYTATLVLGLFDISEVVLIVNRLKKRFNNLKVVKVIEAWDLDTSEKVSDLVISTVDLPDYKFPWILVSQFINEEDEKKIQAWIDTCNNLYDQMIVNQNERLTVQDLLEEQNIVIYSKDLRYMQAIPIAAQPLLSSGKITSHYIRAIQELAETYGPYMVVARGVALIHANPSDGVKQMCMGMLVSKQGIYFGHPNFDPVHIVIVLGVINGQMHSVMLDQLRKLFKDPDFVYSLLNTETRSEVLNEVNKLLRKQVAAEDNQR